MKKCASEKGGARESGKNSRGRGVSLCYFTYRVSSCAKEIGCTLTKFHPLWLLWGHWQNLERDESSIMCLSSYSTITVTFTHLRFRHLLLPITAFLSPFLSSFVLFLFLSSHLFPSVILCTYKRPSGPLTATRVCVCPPACQVKEQGGDLQLYLYSFILHRASCRPSFYDCHIRYLTYHCHKAQQTQGRGNCTCTQHAYMCYWNELMVELQTDVHDVMSEVLLYRIMHLSQDSKLGRLWYHLLHLFACQPYNRSLSLQRSVQTAFWTSMQHANNIHHPPFFGSDKIIRHQHKEVFCILRQRSCYKTS